MLCRCPGWGSGVRVPHLFVVDLEVAERHFDVALGAVDVPEDVPKREHHHARVLLDPENFR